MPTAIASSNHPAIRAIIEEVAGADVAERYKLAPGGHFNWCDRDDGLPVELVVQRQSRDTARQVGLEDRGTLEPGMLADVNVIDFDNLTLRAPEMVYDLPRERKTLDSEGRGLPGNDQEWRGHLPRRRGHRSHAWPAHPRPSEGLIITGSDLPDVVEEVVGAVFA